MEDESDHLCLCCLRGIMPTISKKWAICIISELGRRPSMRFSEIMKDCGEISPKSLTDVLKDLQDTGLIERTSYGEIPPRVEYSLTEHGRDLKASIVPLLRWAKRHNQLYMSYRKPELARAPDP
ncbi:MAG: helix-turn-helix transcriptional regulator [Methanoregula sp.]|jgi:DNA-binding HxlR family transcriptional regulator|uniref:winged helix-turn-helix transcriptional regulator n=1 Tax=Methanoregula sp. TaxID=2052170 RepID=UPI0025F6346B|nr:helix-turn-helix domain-containing protein [Methanoregula sp.]MCK9632633.1 helix-turn-helix transcriptional regulator [Methanoregula sp.]